MEYAKKYLSLYLAASDETRKASKAHWLKIFAAEYAAGDVDGLAGQILAVMSLADDLIARNIVVSA